jgi:hypothetical protein
MVSIRTRVTRDTFPFSVLITFGTLQATLLGSQAQVVRPFFEACDDIVAYAKGDISNYGRNGFELGF